MNSKIIILLFVISFTIVFHSCKNDDDSTPETSTSVNDFVWKAMNTWYYWQNSVSDLADNRFSNNSEYNTFIEAQQSPDNLFHSLLYDYGDTDRFSWIVDDYHELENQFSNINYGFGMDYGLVLTGQNTSNLFGYIQYVLPNSPAENAGLQRGDIFTHINGTQLTTSNYLELLENSTIELKLGYIENGQLFETNEVISLTKVEIHENPIYLSTIMNEGTHKIGYLVYNGFRANYNDELNDAIGQLKNQGITDLILDLRYNGGGSVQTSTYLGSMITGQFPQEAFTHLTFNKKRSSNNSTYLFENEAKLFDNSLEQTGTFPLNHLNLNRLYVITTRGTASASEMLISCMRPYINVVTVGTQTYGKTVGSITLYDSPSSYYTSNENINNSHTWALQPIVFEYKNTKNQSGSTTGIVPNVEINELNFLENLEQLGNPNEPLLSAAISQITNDNRHTPNIHSSFENHLFKTTQTLNRWETEMYLDKGFYFSP